MRKTAVTLLVVTGISVIVVGLSIQAFPEWLSLPGGLLLLIAAAFVGVADLGGKLKDWRIFLFGEETATTRISTPQTSQPQGHGSPTPKINPLPDNIYGKIAFLRGKDNDREYIIANSDGSEESVMTKASWGVDFPRIAPGGEKVVFVSRYEGRQSVYVINRDGSDLKKLTGPSVATHEGYASWSPDGTKLIYTRVYSNNSNDIYVMDSNGDDQKNLTNIFTLGKALSQNTFSEFPWSPDSQRIVFSSNRDGSYKIYIMDKNGGNVRQIKNNLETQDYGAVWAPNRNTIAYVSTVGVNDATDIFTLNVDSPKSKPINITNNPYHNAKPVWSPDGTQILFVSNRDGNKELYIMNSDGSNVRRITRTAEPEDDPSWLR